MRLGTLLALADVLSQTTLKQTDGDKEKDKEKEKGKHLSPGQIENESSIDQDFGSGSIVSGRR